MNSKSYGGATLVAFATILATLAMIGSDGAARAQTRAPTDKAQIEALEHRFVAAFRAKDVNRIMSVYAPGSRLFVFDVTPPRQHVGRADYKKDWEGFLGQFKGPVALELSDLSITTDGRLAFSHSIQHVTGQTTDGKSMDMTVRVTDDYEKIGGRWYTVTEHVSVPVDINSGRADLQSKL